MTAGEFYFKAGADAANQVLEFTFSVAHADDSANNFTNLGKYLIYAKYFDQVTGNVVQAMSGSIAAANFADGKEVSVTKKLVLSKGAPTDIRNLEGATASSLATYTGTGPVGTGITSFTPTVEVFTIGASPTNLAINLKTKTVLAAAVAAAQKLETMICLTVKAAATIQYLCATTSNTLSATQQTLTHKILNASLKPAASLFSTVTTEIGTAIAVAGAKTVEVYSCTSAATNIGTTAIAGSAVVPNRMVYWPTTGNTYTTDKTTLTTSLQIAGEPLNASNTNAKLTTLLTALKGGMATSMLASSYNLSATVNTKAAETALAAPAAAAACPTCATCTGALSTIVAAGASIAALAMAF